MFGLGKMLGQVEFAIDREIFQTYLSMPKEKVTQYPKSDIEGEFE